jgi:REP element-mobilizing transposase RayT
LQGDRRGWVKEGKILSSNKQLVKINKERITGRVVKLDRASRDVVFKAIEDKAKEIDQVIFASSICSNHVHLVLENIDESVGVIVGIYKAAATKALREKGFAGKVWTRGYDKRYCYDDGELEARMEYVNGH